MIPSIAMTGVIAGILSAVHVIRIMRVVIILGSVMVVYNKYKSRYTMNHGRYDGYNSLYNGKYNGTYNGGYNKRNSRYDSGYGSRYNMCNGSYITFV